MITYKLTIALLKKRIVQNTLVGLILLLITTLLYVALSIVNQSSSFDEMFSRANAVHDLLLLDKSVNDANRHAEWWLDQEDVEDVVAYETYMINANYRVGEEEISETVFLTEYQDIDVDQLYRTETEKVSPPTDKEVIVNRYFARSRNLSIGDEIQINIDGLNHIFTIKDLVVDPQFSNPFLSPNRLYVATDYFDNNAIINPTVLLGIQYRDINTVDVPSLMKAYELAIPDVIRPLHIEYKSIKSSYSLLLNIISSILFIVALFSFIIAVVVIRNSIRSIFDQQYRAIGVKKAIGYTNRMITQSLIYAFSSIAIIASLIGILVGLPITGLINSSLGKDVLTRTTSGLDQYAIVTFLVIVLLVYSFTYLSARKARNIMPVQAIKYGMPQDHVTQNNLQLKSLTRLPLVVALSIKHILGSRKKSFNTIVILTLLIYVVLVISNTGTTLMNKSHFASYLLGLRMPEYTVSSATNDASASMLSDLQEVNENHHVTYYEQNMGLSTKDINGEVIAAGGQTIYGDYPNDLIVLESGRMPRNESELVISAGLVRRTGKSLGDYIILESSTDKTSYLVTGINNSVSYNAEGYVKLIKTPEANTKFGNGYFWVYLEEGSVIIETVEKEIQASLGDNFQVSLYDANVQNILSTLEAFPMVISMVLILFTVISAIIMVNFTIIDIQHSKRSFGIMKAIGYSNKQIVAILCTRTILLTILGTLLGLLLNSLTMNALMNGIFAITPFSDVQLPVLFNWFLSFAMVFIFIIVNLIATLIPSRNINKISPKQLIME